MPTYIKQGSENLKEFQDSNNHCYLAFDDNVWAVLNSFMTEAVVIIETTPLTCSENQWTGFYMIMASIMKELKCFMKRATMMKHLFFPKQQKL